MAELTPLYMDISNAYSGDELGLPWRDIIGEGIIAAGDLAVSAGAGNSVNVTAGACFVLGDTNPARQPNYRCYNDAVVNRGISPDPSNPRIVLVVAQIVDESFAGVGRRWEVQAIHGTPAAAPATPAVPASAIPLAEILVPAAAASSAAYTITDKRLRAITPFYQPHAHVRRGVTAQSIPTTGWTVVNRDTVLLDSERMTLAGADRITIQRSGLWQVQATVLFDSNATGTRGCRIEAVPQGFIPASQVFAKANDGAGGTSVTTPAIIIRLDAGNLLTAQAYHEAVGALNVTEMSLVAIWLGA